MIRFNITTRLFSTESVSSNNSVSESESGQYIVIFKDSNTRRVKQKKIKARTKLDALGKFRNSLRFHVLRGGFYRPLNIRAFELPKEMQSAVNYRSTLEGES